LEKGGVTAAQVKVYWRDPELLSLEPQKRRYTLPTSELVLEPLVAALRDAIADLGV
jgi:hypothetical protein